ncbi:unnamed protein product, partial [Cyprideis torosa]
FTDNLAIGVESRFIWELEETNGAQTNSKDGNEIGGFFRYTKSLSGSTSTTFAPRFAENGTTVIDNSSAWRMDPSKKLIVPEINAQELNKEDKIIANPNCSTIQMVMALAPLHKAYGIKRIVVSTYQSVSGTGKAAVEQMEAESRGEDATKVYPYQIFRNALPHCDVFEEADYTKEEWK